MFEKEDWGWIMCSNCQDNWLPESQSGRVLSLVGDIPPSATVSTLIDHDLRGWGASEIVRNFLPSESAIIKAILLNFFHECRFYFLAGDTL